MLIAKRADIIGSMITEYTDPDFSALINDMIAAGLSVKEIAAYVRVTQPAITRIKNGYVRQPLYGSGVRIVQLHRLEMKQLRRMRKFYSV